MMYNFPGELKTALRAMAIAVLFGVAACQSPDSGSATRGKVEAVAPRPNIVLIYADDMGWGDIKAYNPDSRIPTPSLDALAADGIIFADAHSSSAVCTPSRYSLLTGRYSWRTSLKSGVLNGRSPLLIDTERETLADMLKHAGYNTMMIGKWHLGLGVDEPNYAGSLSPGPNQLGFDYFFGIPASLDHEPYVLVENDRVTTPLTGKTIARSGMRRGGGEGFWREGEIGEGFVHAEVLPTLARKAVEKIEEVASDDKPFFLYLPLTSPHTPWLPTEEFRGISGAGYYGDFVAQTDGVVGMVMQAIDVAGIAGDTIVIYSSDNGAHWKPEDIESYGHRANGSWRGQKADIYEGGHRVPLIIRWPGRVLAGSSSDALVVLNDIMATIADIVDVELGDGTAPDSFDFSDVLLSSGSGEHNRPAVVHHSHRGRYAVRRGDWKLVEGLGSGGFSRPQDVDPEPGQIPYQLYNLAEDPAETTNVADDDPERVAELLAVLNQIRDAEGE